MAVLGPAACFAADIEKFIQRFEQPVRFAAQMRGVEAAAFGDDPDQVLDFGSAGETARGVDQTGGDAEAAGVHGGGHLLGHGRPLGRVGRSVLKAHDRAAKRALADQQTLVQGHRITPAAFEVFDGLFPVDFKAVGGVLLPARFLHGAVKWKRAVAAVAVQFGGEARERLADRIRSVEGRVVGVGVDVDETGAADVALGIEGPAGRFVRVGRQHNFSVADAQRPLRGSGQVATIRRFAREDAGVDDAKIEHGFGLYRMKRSWFSQL